MKKLFFLFILISITTITFAQIPHKLSYQAIIRDSAFVALDSVQIGIQLSLLSDTSSSSPVYTEIHTPTTSTNGLVQLHIGEGTTTDTFTKVNWAEGPYFLMTKIDPSGGTDYTITGTTQLLSVPYAHRAATASVADTAGRTDSVLFRVSQAGDSLILGNGSSLIIPGLSEANPFLSQGFDQGHPQNSTRVDTVSSSTRTVMRDRNE